MPLSAGEKLGPYEILELIGAGGMGEVYRARDTRLNRDVAIKVSAERFNDRFSREAQAVAALNHPNICSLFDVGPNFLVMELVEGETLKGPLPLETALKFARQIADALEEAQPRGSPSTSARIFGRSAWCSTRCSPGRGCSTARMLPRCSRRW
jgi:serine/threonine protein kinase